MTGKEAIMGLLASLRGPRRHPDGYYYETTKLGEALSRCWDDIALIADLRPTDRVLDMGCAEGLVTLEVAKRVAHADGVEILPGRVALAQREAEKRGLSNAKFVVGSALDYPLEPGSYDVTMLLGVLCRRYAPGKYVGLDALERLLAATRRQIVVRVGLSGKNADHGVDLAGILSTMDAKGFDGIAFARHEPRFHLIFGNRRGSDARLKVVPPLAIVPTQTFTEQNFMRGATIGNYSEFGL